MKSLMILGAVIGFGVALVFGLMSECQWTTVLGRGSVAALGAGWLMRWWGRTWIKGLQSTVNQRRKELEEAAHKKETQATSPAKV